LEQVFHYFRQQLNKHVEIHGNFSIYRMRRHYNKAVKIFCVV
jgi:hypothetical protein